LSLSLIDATRRIAPRTRSWWCLPHDTANLARGGRDGGGLHRRIRRDARNAPDEPCQLACDCGLPQLAPRHHVTLAQPSLCPPGNLAHRLAHGVNGGRLMAGDAGREPVAVRSLDQQGAGVNIAGLCDGTPIWRSRPVECSAWHQAEVGHEVGCGRKWLLSVPLRGRPLP
jgi:hypothetical protein